MNKTPEFKSFNEAREMGLSLEEIKKATRNSTEQLRKEISQQLIDALYKGITIKKGEAGKREELNYLKALTSKGNRIEWSNNKEADIINAGDVIQIVINGNVKEIRKNGKKIGVAVEGFESSNKKPATPTTPNVAPVKPEVPTTPKSTPQTASDTIRVSSSISQPFIDNGSLRDEPRGDVETEEVAGTIVIGYVEDGKSYIIGENGEPKLVELEDFSPEYKENLKNYEATLNKVSNFKLLYQALLKEEPENKDLINDFNNVNNAIRSFDESEIEVALKTISESMEVALKRIELDNEIDLNSDLSVLNYIRDELGSYDLASLYITEKKFNEYTKIDEDDFQKFIENPTEENESLQKIQKLLGKDFKDIQEQLIKKQREAQQYYLDFKEQKLKENPNITSEELEVYRKEIIYTFMSGYGKSIILETTLSNNPDNSYSYNGEDKYLELFSDIHGIGWFDARDKTWDWGKEVFIFIGTEILAIAAGAVTAGAGAYAVNALVYGTRGIRILKGMYNTGKLANTSLKGATLLQKGGIMSSRVSRLAAMGTIEGSSFYLGYGAAQSGIEGKNMYSTEGLIQSIEFAGAFRGLRGIYKAFGKEIKMDIPLSQQKLKLATQIGIEGVTFSTLGLYHQGVLFEPGEWTAETIIQAFAMATAFKGIGIRLEKIRFRQEGGKVIAENIAKESERFIHPRSKKVYIKQSDGSFTYENGKPAPRNLKPENLVLEAEYRGKTSGGKGTEQNNPIDINIYNTRIEREFSRIFNREININESITLTNGNRTITITKLEGGSKYQINGDTRIYTLKEILGKIEFPFKEAKINSILAQNLPHSTAIDGKGLIFKNHIEGKTAEGIKYKIGRDKGGVYVEYVENGITRRMTQSEILEFMSKPEVKIRLLEKKIQNMTIEDVMNHFKNQPKIVQKIKSIPKIGFEIMKSNIVEIVKKFAGFGVAGVGLDLSVGGVEGETTSEAIYGLFESFIKGGLWGTGGLIVLKLIGGGYKILKFSGGQVKELTGKAFKSAWNNKGKVLVAGILGGALYGIYKVATRENIDEENTEI